MPSTQRAHAPGIAHADQLLRRQRDERIGALDLLQGVDQPVDDRLVVAARRQMDDDLGVGGRLEDAPLAHQFGAQRARIGEIAVMRERKAAAGQVGEHRLDVARRRAARRRIAVMADGEGAFEIERAGGVLAAEDVADEARMPLRDEMALVIGDDAGRLLAAVLERMQAKDRQRAGIGVAEHAEHAAFLVELIVLKCFAFWKARHRLPLPLLPVASKSRSSAWRSWAP
ncbi:MAG: hypothetical protein WDM81_21025 [Rhizomicrobium sp.]